MEHWGVRLREMREKKGMSQGDLSRKTGIDVSVISRNERGDGAKKVTVNMRGRLRQAFSEEEVAYIAGEVDNIWVVAEPPIGYISKEAVSVPILNPKASAGGGNNIESIDVYESGKRLTVDLALFPVPPGRGIRAIQVDGYSMVPVLLPESWVFFDESREWSGDGLYVLVFRGVLMVKQVVADVKTGNLWIRSANPDYESWEYDPTEDQSTMRIVGRVVRVMI